MGKKGFTSDEADHGIDGTGVVRYRADCHSGSGIVWHCSPGFYGSEVFYPLAEEGS